MNSLKEIKGRIASVQSTQKVTSAMKMIASAKLVKFQSQINSFLPYENKSSCILNSLLSSETEETRIDLLQNREVNRVTIIVLSSNSGLCGAFNANIEKSLTERLKYYQNLGVSDIELYPIGKKIKRFVSKNYKLYSVANTYDHLIDKPSFNEIREFGRQLIKDFTENKTDKIEILYNHFKSTAVQLPTITQILPVVFEKPEPEQFINVDYIIEPDRQTVLNYLIPRSVYNKTYLSFLDSVVAESAARTVAMQIATDNAGDLLDELKIQYNKQRQQKITNELLDIVGGSEALK